MSSKSNHLTIVGSPLLQPFISEGAVLFQRAHTQMTVETRGEGGAAGLRSLTQRTADLAATVTYADPALYSSVNLNDHLICVIPFTLVANPAITVTSLTREQIMQIFVTGAITNWRQVGGPDQRIVALTPSESAESRAIFRKTVLGGMQEANKQPVNGGDEAVRDAVAQTPGAIGYLALPSLTTNLRQIAIDGRQPKLDDIQQGAYPFWSFGHLYTIEAGNPNDMSGMGGATTTAGADLTTTYLTFLAGSNGARLARQLGYIPLADMGVLPTGTPSTMPASNGKGMMSGVNATGDGGAPTGAGARQGGETYAVR